MRLLLCSLITLIAMYSHRYFPVKTLTLAPAAHTQGYLYMNGHSSGQSRIEWINQEDFQWRCFIEDDGADHSCGLSMTMNGNDGDQFLDLSGFDTVRVSMNYQGSERRLRFFIRNYEPGLSDIDDIQTAKFNFLSVPVSFVNDPLVLHLEEFSVADWWIHAYQVPRELSQPDFSHVVGFGIDLGYPSPPGQHDFKLNKVEFVGLWISAERWYASILFFWILVIGVLGITQLIRLRHRYYLEKAQHEALAKQNAALKAQTDKYKHLSLRDHLTQLLNRQGLSELIEDNFSLEAQQRVALIIIDLDFFKQVNDKLGHDGGDVVLREVAAIIEKNIRQTDAAGRWGGEEFVVISPDTTVGDAQQFAEKLRRLIATHCFTDNSDVGITVSIGVGEGRAGESFSSLFRRVDVALYQAKAQGRNRTVVAGNE